MSWRTYVTIAASSAGNFDGSAFARSRSIASSHRPLRRAAAKRVELGLHDFGYRSVHLIAKLKQGQVLSGQYQPLRDNWFEIQIRSILEHAWAEIEHEVVYKSGIIFPEVVKRRFARLAGMVELIGDEFLNLREERSRLVEEYKHRYARQLDK